MRVKDGFGGVILALWTKYHKNGDQIKNGWVCDACDRKNTKATPFCPYCGESMKSRISIPTATSVDDFIGASDWGDWINQPTQAIYEIYWRWCIKEEVSPVDKITFMKQVLAECPDLKSSPMKGRRYFRSV